MASGRRRPTSSERTSWKSPFEKWFQFPCLLPRAMNTCETGSTEEAVIVFLFEVFSRIRHGLVRRDLPAARAIGISFCDAMREPARHRRRPDIGGVPGTLPAHRTDRRIATAGLAPLRRAQP